MLESSSLLEEVTNVVREMGSPSEKAALAASRASESLSATIAPLDDGLFGIRDNIGIEAMQAIEPMTWAIPEVEQRLAR
jgi:hypothetical protein